MLSYKYNLKTKMEPTTKKVPVANDSEGGQTSTPPITGAESVEEARAVVNNPNLWRDRDVNFHDNYLTTEERAELVGHIVDSVNFLNSVILDDDQKLVEFLRLSNNIKDNKLVDFSLAIPVDDFRISGVFDISVLQQALSGISHNVPNQNQEAQVEGTASKTRQQIEQNLIKADLSAQLATLDEATSLTSQGAQDEFSEAFKKRAQEVIKSPSGFRKLVKDMAKAIKLAT